jgi:hypothetical protein
MNYLPPSLRGRRINVDPSSPIRSAGPKQASKESAARRLAICFACEFNSGGCCRQFGCCEKPVAELVKLATRSCPAKKWAAEITL